MKAVTNFCAYLNYPRKSPENACGSNKIDAIANGKYVAIKHDCAAKLQLLLTAISLHKNRTVKATATRLTIARRGSSL